MMKVTRTKEGLAYLHVWREGEEYFRQKSDKFITEWTNIMYASVVHQPIENVYYVDLSRQTLDFPESTFNAANAYHVLEHLTPQEGERFVAEIFRVLKPGSVFRVSVPDLESICRQYLHQLEITNRAPTVQNIRRYQWNVMEIFEQMVREKTGGLMLDTIRSGNYDKEYLHEHYSDVYRPFLQLAQENPITHANSPSRKTALQRLTSLTPIGIYQALKWRIDRCRQRYWEHRNKARSHPRLTKEAVRWMYDRVSLGLLLGKVGFVEIRRKDFKHSDIPHWSRYDLDCSNFANRAMDPSVYMEARKP